MFIMTKKQNRYGQIFYLMQKGIAVPNDSFFPLKGEYLKKDYHSFISIRRSFYMRHAFQQLELIKRKSKTNRTIGIGSGISR